MTAAKRFAEIRDVRMAYVDEGEGEPTFVLLHGNPTSSYLWRDVIGHLLGVGRCVAPDLVGYGDSDKLPDPGPHRYAFGEQAGYLDAFLDAIDLPGRIVLVSHDWGTALAHDWARRHPERVAGLAYMEGIVAPMRWDEWPESARRLFQAFRTDAGEELVLEKNVFVERVLPGAIQRTLTEEEMAEYRRPFAEPGEGRRPILSLTRCVPFDGQPAEMQRTVEAYDAWLAGSDVPKLFVDADPGSMLNDRLRAICRAWPNTTTVTVPGLHLLQEDSAAEIGEAVAAWARTLSARTSASPTISSTDA